MWVEQDRHPCGRRTTWCGALKPSWDEQGIQREGVAVVVRSHRRARSAFLQGDACPGASEPQQGEEGIPWERYGRGYWSLSRWGQCPSACVAGMGGASAELGSSFGSGLMWGGWRMWQGGWYLCECKGVWRAISLNGIERASVSWALVILGETLCTVGDSLTTKLYPWN